MDTVFLKTVWLYLPDGSKERIIAQTGGDKGISFDSVRGGAERKHYFKYDEYSITQTEKGDYAVSPIDDECEKIYYPNGTYEYVSKVVPHDGFWGAHVHNSVNKRRVACWSRRRFSLEHRRDGRWYENEDGEEGFLSFDERLYDLTLNDNVLHIMMKSDEYAEDDVRENAVSHPSHYAALDPEPITFIRDRDYLTGSALKYIFRAGHKYGADESVDMGKAAWYLRELIAEQGDQTVIAILRNVYWDTIDRQLAPEDRAMEIRDRLTDFVSAISHNHLNDYISGA